MRSDPQHDAMFATVDMHMREERPGSDQLAMERARARSERALFGDADPARFGRYEVLEPIAGGGMGLVYAAYDPELDRKVALKLVLPGRDDPQAHARLIKEARALARLDHPNVVRVHDVVSDDGQIVIVMELLEGETLARWQAAAPRSWRELVAAYAQAGEGLLAAHSIDVVHRDFKPSNAIIGADGRVRVLDFGVARIAIDAADTESGPRRRDGSTAVLRTVPGTMLGTPAFASPEQLAGEPVTTASDQFSFCVALHGALEGVAPFAGKTLDDLLANITAGEVRIATEGRIPPAWLRKVLRRGLTVDPSRRYPSMRALLAELERPRGWKRWRWPVLASLLVLATVVATAAVRRAGAEDCSGGADDVAAVWGPGQRDALGAALGGIGGPYAVEAKAQVLEGLDAQARRWATVHRDACLAHRSGVESAALLDRKMLCLRRHLDDLRATVAVLEHTDAATLPRTVDVVAGMPSSAMCADAARVSAGVDPPRTLAQALQVEAVRSRITTAAALHRAGRSEEATVAARAATVDAERTGYPSVVAEAQLELGRILIAQSDGIAAAPVLRSAMKTALATAQPRLAVEAGARLIYAEGVQTPDLDRLRRDLDILEPMSRAIGDDRFVRPLLFNNAGAVYQAAKHRDDALHYLQLAHDALGGEPPADLELTAIDQSLAIATPDPALRAQLSRDVWLRKRAALGDHHLTTLEAQLVYAHVTADPATAYETLASTCEAYRRVHPSLVDRHLVCDAGLAVLARELGKLDAARAAYAAVIAAAASAGDPDRLVVQRLAVGELALLDGSIPQAKEAFGAVIEACGQAVEWWKRKYALQAELGLGRAAIAEGDPQRTRPHIEAAAAGFDDITHINSGIVYRLQLEEARAALAAIRSASPERQEATRH